MYSGPLQLESLTCRHKCRDLRTASDQLRAPHPYRHMPLKRLFSTTSQIRTCRMGCHFPVTRVDPTLQEAFRKMDRLSKVD